MSRPKDIHGNEIVMGQWYWAKNRRGQVVGTGKFASNLGSDECTWFINGTGYGHESLTFVRVLVDPELYFTLNDPRAPAIPHHATADETGKGLGSGQAE